MRNSPIGIILVNYNMPERSEALFEAVMDTVDPQVTDYDFIVVDNGSDMVMPPRCTTIGLEYNVQTTNGWLMGLHYADALEQIFQHKYFAYWILITSGEFLAEQGDILTPMVDYLMLNEQCVGIHPSLSPDSTSFWKHMYHDPMWDEPTKPTWMIDNIAALWRADWFNSIGRFDPRLVYAHGSDLETCYLAREQGKEIRIHNDVQVKKVDNIGYKMDRMGMTAEERLKYAGDNMNRVFDEKYGEGWKEFMLNGHTWEDLKGGTE